MTNIRFLSNSNLKLLAVLSMLIDHLGYAVVYYSPRWHEYYQLCRDIGRIAFPIYCFLLVEGFFHTRDRRRYALGLLLFAVLSELPFDLLFNTGRSPLYSQNVFLTLLLGLLVIWGIEYFHGKIWMQTLIFAAGMTAGWKSNCDYDWRGVLLITVFYLCRRDMLALTIVGAFCLTWEWKAIFAFLPLNLYNGQRGWLHGKWTKYLFYLFYPVHLLLLCWLRYRLFAISPAFL